MEICRRNAAYFSGIILYILPAKSEYSIISDMFHFFTEKTSISDEKVLLTPEDYNHAVNVLRMRKGEKIMISDEEGRDYYCTVQGVVPEEMALRIHMDDVAAVNHELPARISLYQSLPKSDKFEWILQKATELGVTDIYPVESKNCVVKVGKEKSEKKTERWQKIAEAAAKQSKRSVIPEVHDILPFTEAVRRVSEEQGVSIIPYEEENGMAGTCEAILRFLPGTDRLGDLANGLIGLSDLVVFAAFITLFVFLTVLTLEGKRVSGRKNA